ncbi:hypothetical protein FB192DRAFT_1404528 [Mucor lusitanicus]|uniref:Uncharacterized protein n=1 Tax=Mucor circinelloides f. lusitanicus TaxID=29924 RepID=A0A8H4B7F6_MUCCL|nr:hypothetical protein FB192DRAFT_1404528 [Mucor lusitanicus]
MPRFPVRCTLLIFYIYMPYLNFEENTHLYQLNVWHTITTIRIALQALDRLSFYDSREEIRNVLNSISTNNTRYSPFHYIASTSHRFDGKLTCYNMSSCKYLEIFNSLYKALAVNASPTAETSRDITFCNDSYNAALETYSANLLLLKKDIFAGAGAYTRDTFEGLFKLTWKH